MSVGRHAASRRHWPVAIAVIVVLVLLVGAGSAVAAYRYDNANLDRILPGVRVAGVDVGGMTREEATAAVGDVSGEWLSRPFRVTAGGRTWEATPAELGVSADVGAIIDQALSVNERYSWPARVLLRMSGGSTDVSLGLDYELGNGGQASDFVKTKAGKVLREPIDAAVVLGNQGQAVFKRSHPGREIDPVASVRAIREALKERDDEVKLVLRSVEPKVPTKELGETIVVDLSENRLTLYDGFKADRTYRVATAAPDFETPLGAWKVINKAENPTWVNPAPNGWGAGAPAQIPPGPGNPLGTRAIYLDAPGIRIHGTYDSGSIGTYASHGCIRMNISDVEELYPHVPIGTPVLIVP